MYVCDQLVTAVHPIRDVRVAWSVHTESMPFGELNIRKLQEPLMMAAIQ